VWAQCEQDAWDEACDAGILDPHQVEESEIIRNEESGEESLDSSLELMRLGNASEPFAFDQPWIATVPLDKLEPKIVALFAEAKGAGRETLC
jgi:hypothetical protein